MNRLPDWRPAFVAALDAHRPHPFAWSRHDCGILTGDCIKAVTGLDIIRNFRGHYRSAVEAQAFVAMCGYETAIDVVARRFAEIHPSQAIVGDVAVIKTRTGPATAPVMGSELAAYALNGVLGAVPLALAQRAFRIEIR